MCCAAADEVANHLLWLEEHPQLTGVLGRCVEHTFIEQIDEPQDLLSLLIAEVEHAGLPYRCKHAGLQKPVGELRGLSTEWAVLATPDDTCTAHESEILYKGLDDEFASDGTLLRMKSAMVGVRPRTPRQVCRFTAQRSRSARMMFIPLPTMAVSRPMLLPMPPLPPRRGIMMFPFFGSRYTRHTVAEFCNGVKCGTYLWTAPLLGVLELVSDLTEEFLTLRPVSGRLYTFWRKTVDDAEDPIALRR